jgi:hypothetical protein
MNELHEVTVDGSAVSTHTTPTQAASAAEAYARTWGRDGLDVRTVPA